MQVQASSFCPGLLSNYGFIKLVLSAGAAEEPEGLNGYEESSRVVEVTGTENF